MKLVFKNTRDEEKKYEEEKKNRRGMYMYNVTNVLATRKQTFEKIAFES